LRSGGSFDAAVSIASNAAAACADTPGASPWASAARASSRCARTRSHGVSLGESIAASSDIRAAASSPAASWARPRRIRVDGPGARLTASAAYLRAAWMSPCASATSVSRSAGTTSSVLASARSSALLAAAGKPSAQYRSPSSSNVL
jgi:hypothetical protein